MNTGEMLGFTNRLKSITESKVSSHHKDLRLANLMTDLEGAYQIPALQDEQFEKQYPHLMQLYRTVSDERSL